MRHHAFPLRRLLAEVALPLRRVVQQLQLCDGSLVCSSSRNPISKTFCHPAQVWLGGAAGRSTGLYAAPVVLALADLLAARLGAPLRADSRAGADELQDRADGAWALFLLGAAEVCGCTGEPRTPMNRAF